MAEEKVTYDTDPKNLNEVKKRFEAGGGDWEDAVEKIKEATGGKNIAAAMKQGWTAKDFAKLLLGDGMAKAQEEEALPEQLPSEKQSEAHSPIVHHEAPASLNTYYISPGGFRWQLTIRPGLAANEMVALLERAKKAEDWLKKKNYKPYVPFKGNSNANAQQASGNGGEAPLCPTHGRPMLPSKKGEGFYCPVKIADDDGTGKPVYCKQRVK